MPHPIPEPWFQWQEPFIRAIAPCLRKLSQFYFRVQMTGWERLPPGQVLLVGNHNGLLAFEVLMFFEAWWQRFGPQHLVLGLAHSFVLRHPFFRWCLPRLGAIPADPQTARTAFEHGYSVLVYPGGTRECFRPFFERKQVQFFQRKGFVSLAREKGVPIVPVLSVGAEKTYWIVASSKSLADFLGLQAKWRVSHFPVTLRMLGWLALVFWKLAGATFWSGWLVLGFSLIFIPLPARMRFELLDPICVTPDQTDDQVYQEVVQALQKRLWAYHRQGFS